MLPDLRLAGVDGGEFVEERAKAVDSGTVFEFASGDFLERGLGSCGGGDRISHFKLKGVGVPEIFCWHPMGCNKVCYRVQAPPGKS